MIKGGKMKIKIVNKKGKVTYEGDLRGLIKDTLCCPDLILFPATEKEIDESKIFLDNKELE